MLAEYKSIILFAAVALLMAGLIILVAICNAVWYCRTRQSSPRRRRSREHSEYPSCSLREPLLQPKDKGGVNLNRLTGQHNIHQLLPHFLINPTSIDYSPTCVEFECTAQLSPIGSAQADRDHVPTSADGHSTM